MAVGDILRAFSGDPKYNPLYVSEEQRQTDDALTRQIRENLGLANAALAKYGANVESDTSRADAALRGYESLIKAITSRGNDPLNDYRQLLDYTLSKIPTSVIEPLTRARSNRLRQSALARGINPGLYSSTYDRLNQAGIDSNAYLQAYNAALGNAGTDFSRLEGARKATDAFNLDMTPRYLGLLNETAARPLLTERARSGMLSDLIGQAGGTTALNRGNIAAWIKHKSGLEKWADAADALKSGAWEGLSFYQNLMGLGGMGGGGGMGGMGGSGGGQQKKAPAYPGMISNEPDYDASYDRYLRGSSPSSQNYPEFDYGYR